MQWSRSSFLGDKPDANHPELTYAGFGRRAFSLVVDALLISCPMFLLLPRVYDQPPLTALAWLGLSNVLGYAYFIVLHAHWGRTIGKMLAGITVRRLDGAAIGYREALLRSSVDLALGIAGFAMLYMTLSNWQSPDWSSVPYSEKALLIMSRDPTGGVLETLGLSWFWSELVVMQLNAKRRAAHDYIAGTVVVVE